MWGGCPRDGCVTAAITSGRALTHEGGVGWTKDADGWLVGDPCYDSWPGVVCDANGDAIIGLDLTGFGAHGVITADIVQHLPILEGIKYLKLEGNSIDPRWPPEFQAFIDDRCAAIDSTCSGMPYKFPFSCGAFGWNARPKIDEPTRCDPCDEDLTGTRLLIVLAFCVVFLILGAYIVVIVKYPGALRRWVSFAIILVNHTQTLAILGSLNLTWPPTVKKILTLLTLFQIESASCLLPPGVPSFWLYAFNVLGFSSFVLGVCTISMLVCERRGKEKAADRAEFVLTVLFATLLMYALQVCSKVMRKFGPIATVAKSIAIPLLCLMLVLVVRFWFKVEAYRRAIAGCGWRSAGWCTSMGDRVFPRSLKLRVFYLTHRFALHAQRWQFVIWTRQVALVVLIAANETFADNMPHLIKYARYPGAGAAVLIIAIAWRLHAKVGPYAYKTQNALESFLFASNIILLIMGCVYQYLVDDTIGTWRPGAALNASAVDDVDDVEDAVQRALAPFDVHGKPKFLVVEVAMLISLVLSVLATSIYVIHDVRAKRRQLEGMDATLVLTAADQHVDEPITRALLEERVRLISCEWLLAEDGGGALKSIDGRTRLPDMAYLNEVKAVELLKRADRSILMLSYGWETLQAPDPSGRLLKMVRAHLESMPGAEDCGLFWDVLSLPALQEAAVGEVGPAPALPPPKRGFFSSSRRAKGPPAEDDGAISAGEVDGGDVEAPKSDGGKSRPGRASDEDAAPKSAPSKELPTNRTAGGSSSAFSTDRSASSLKSEMDALKGTALWEGMKAAKAKRHVSSNPAVQALLAKRAGEGGGGDAGGLGGVDYLRAMTWTSLASTTDLAGLLCASVTGVTVLCVKQPPPPRPHELDGYVMVFDYAKYAPTKDKLRAKLSEAVGGGRVTTCITVGAHARVKFAEHASAEALVAKARESPKGVLKAELMHLTEAYDERGRCVAEQGIALAVAAHLAQAEEQGQLPIRFLEAQSKRPKLVELHGEGDARAPALGKAPQKVLAATAEALQHSVRFMTAQDREDVRMSFAQIEFIIDRSMDEATQLQQLDKFTISPALIQQLRMISSVVIAPPANTCPVNCVRSPCRTGALVTSIIGDDADTYYEAGLHVGSVIVAVDRKVMRNLHSVGQAVIKSVRGSGEAELTLSRRTRREVVDLGLYQASLGIDLCPSPRGIGALVTAVKRKSRAAQHGLRVGDTVLSVNEAIGESAEHVLAMIKKERYAALVLERFTKDLSFLRAKLGEEAVDKATAEVNGEGDADTTPDKVIAIDGVTQTRGAKALAKSQNADFKRGNFTICVISGGNQSATIVMELTGSSLKAPLPEAILIPVMKRLQAGAGPNAPPFPPLTGMNVVSTLQRAAAIPDAAPLAVVVDGQLCPGFAFVTPLNLIKSQFKPVRVIIQLAAGGGSMGVAPALGARQSKADEDRFAKGQAMARALGNGDRVTMPHLGKGAAGSSADNGRNSVGSQPLPPPPGGNGKDVMQVL